MYIDSILPIIYDLYKDDDVIPAMRPALLTGNIVDPVLSSVVIFAERHERKDLYLLFYLWSCPRENDVVVCQLVCPPDMVELAHGMSCHPSGTFLPCRALCQYSRSGHRWMFWYMSVGDLFVHGTRLLCLSGCG